MLRFRPGYGEAESLENCITSEIYFYLLGSRPCRAFLKEARAGENTKSRPDQQPSEWMAQRLVDIFCDLLDFCLKHAL